MRARGCGRRRPAGRVGERGSDHWEAVIYSTYRPHDADVRREQFDTPGAVRLPSNSPMTERTSRPVTDRAAAAADDNEPGRRSGEGSMSLHAHLANDANRKAMAAPRKPIERSRHSVLVVDDNPAMRYSVARALRAAGFATIEAAAGMEAVRLAPAASAVILDMHLPDVDGLEVCRLVRANPASAQVPVVHMSAVHIDAEDMEESARAGADGYLVAPLHPDQLLSVIEGLLLRNQDGT